MKVRFESNRQVPNPQPTLGWRTWLRQMTLLFNLEATSWRQYVSMKEYSLVQRDVFGFSKWKCTFQFLCEGMKFASILQDLTIRWNARILLPTKPDGLRFGSLQSRWIWYFCHNSFRQHKMWQKRRMFKFFSQKHQIGWGLGLGQENGRWNTLSNLCFVLLQTCWPDNENTLV